MSCAEKWLSRKVVCRTRISLVCYTEPELIPQLTPWGPWKKLWKCQWRLFPSVCGAVQSHLSLESQGAEFECCQSHATKMTFSLIDLPLIQSVSCLRVDGYGMFFRCWVFPFFTPGLARAKYTWEASCIIIKNISLYAAWRCEICFLAMSVDLVWQSTC